MLWIYALVSGWESRGVASSYCRLGICYRRSKSAVIYFMLLTVCFVTESLETNRFMQEKRRGHTGLQRGLSAAQLLDTHV